MQQLACTVARPSHFQSAERQSFIIIHRYPSDKRICHSNNGTGPLGPGSPLGLGGCAVTSGCPDCFPRSLMKTNCQQGPCLQQQEWCNKEWVHATCNLADFSYRPGRGRFLSPTQAGSQGTQRQLHARLSEVLTAELAVVTSFVTFLACVADPRCSALQQGTLKDLCSCHWLSLQPFEMAPVHPGACVINSNDDG